MSYFTIPLMFFACLEWQPSTSPVKGFKFEQPITIKIEGAGFYSQSKPVVINNIQWIMYDLRDDCPGLMATNNAYVSLENSIVFIRNKE